MDKLPIRLIRWLPNRSREEGITVCRRRRDITRTEDRPGDCRRMRLDRRRKEPQEEGGITSSNSTIPTAEEEEGRYKVKVHHLRLFPLPCLITSSNNNNNNNNNNNTCR